MEFVFAICLYCVVMWEKGDTTDLQLSVLAVSESVAILHWNNFRTYDHRTILGWVLYTRVA